ncbi:hypothetical protein MNBD_GAMMA09-3498 [hydrothermal vent metagenome]|uniref:Uncharacterized protein n=1 Tax=hydrothermal vent metagenome TaxID=652676 RepID=A0A3B0XSR8_9ZZZZ
MKIDSIKVQINPLIPHYGQYDVNKNILMLKHSNLALNSAVVQSFFIHEGVHMGNDVDKIGIVKGVDEEAAGFIAQAIYFRAETGRYLSDPNNNPKINKVFSQANAAAISVINKSSTDI